MTATAARLPPALTKELSALLPTYGATLVAVVVGSMSDSYFLIASGLLGFAFGSVTLGAQSFGHEYSHRTLGLLLSQPLDRRRLFLNKLLVLSVMLGTLTGVTLVLFDDVLQRAASPHTEPPMLVLAAACGLFVAPWLTMLCRNTLAAVVFTIAIPGVLTTGADIAGGLIYGLNNAAAIDRFRLIVFWRGMFLICALSAVASWRMFLRLEVIEGHGPHMQLPESLRVGSDITAPETVRRRHPVWALVAKEVRLQQIAFVVAALFALAWMGLEWLEWSTPNTQPLPLLPLTMLYAGILAMLIGSLASAEERHLGTLEGQILVPMPGWQQWLVKVGVVLAMVFLLCAALPAVLASLTPGDQSLDAVDLWQVAAIFLLLTAGSLYLSSLCRTGVGALVLSFPTFVATVFFVRTVTDVLWRIGLFTISARPWLGAHRTGLVLVTVAAGFVALLLWLAFVNHRTADRGMNRIVKQALAIAGYIAVGLTVLVALGLR
jgi:MFS family permease